MNYRNLSIWTNARFSDDAATLLREVTANHRLILAHELSQDEAAQALREADVAFGQPDANIVLESSRLKWVHVSSAGYTAFDRDDLKSALRERGAHLSNSSSVFDEPCAQHLLAMMLAGARRLLPAYEVQLSDHDWKAGRRGGESVLLNGQHVLILGYGAIGRRLVELLAPFEMRVVALRRQPHHEDGIEVIGEDEVERALGEADHIVNILPDNASTRGWMNAERFALLKRGTRFYNIGRGVTVDQNALLSALERQQLELAYLDVCDPEPLPPDHALWSAPRCFLTPHRAGGHAYEGERLVRHFERNLRAFEKGKPLVDLVL